MRRSPLLFLFTAACFWLATSLVVVGSRNLDSSWLPAGEPNYFRVVHFYLDPLVDLSNERFEFLDVILLWIALFHFTIVIALAAGLTSIVDKIQDRFGFKEKRPPILLPWYNKEQYGRLLIAAPDTGSLAPNYDEWRTRVDAIVDDYRAAGQRIENVVLDVSQMENWCEQQGRVMDAAAAIGIHTHCV